MRTLSQVNNAAGGAIDNSNEQGFDQGMDNYDYILDLNTRRCMIPKNSIIHTSVLCIENWAQPFLNCNFHSVVVLCKLAIPHLIERQGEVVMVSSICGLPQGVST